MKKLIKIIICFMFGLALSSCAGAKGIGERAIIKAVYVDYGEEKYKVSLIVFACEASTDTKSVQEKPQIYCGSGASLDQAIYSAEIKQNKTPFFSQNELLFLSEGAAINKAGEIIGYFSREDAQRPSLSVFITPCTQEKLVACTDNMGNIVREGERLGTGKTENGNVKKLYEFKTINEDGFSGYLPIYRFGSENEYCGIREIVIFNPNAENLLFENNALKLLLLLDGKLSRLTMQNISDNDISFTADSIRICYDKTFVNGSPHLKLIIKGNIKELCDAKGNPTNKNIADKYAHIINEYIKINGTEVIHKTFGAANDVFSYTWHMRGINSKMCDDMINSGNFYTDGRISLESELKVI